MENKRIDAQWCPYFFRLYWLSVFILGVWESWQLPPTSPNHDSASLMRRVFVFWYIPVKARSFTDALSRLPNGAHLLPKDCLEPPPAGTWSVHQSADISQPDRNDRLTVLQLKPFYKPIDCKAEPLPEPQLYPVNPQADGVSIQS